MKQSIFSSFSESTHTLRVLLASTYVVFSFICPLAVTFQPNVNPRAPLVELTYLVFTRMPGGSYRG